MAFLSGTNTAYQRKPQENQYLQGNPETQSNANTNWMAPSPGMTGSSGSSAQAPMQGNPPSAVNNGTMLGQMSSGSGAQMGSPEWVQNYYNQRGVAPQGNSVQYWADKYKEFGEKDPAYYQKFLSNAEEFTGGPQQTAAAMGWGGNNASMLGQQNGQMNGMNMQQMMPMLMQMFQGGMKPQGNMPQQVSNGSLFNAAGNSGGNQMDISSFLNPTGNTGVAGGMMRKINNGQ